MGIILTFLVWALGLLLVAAIGLIIYARWHYGTLEKCGFPVVKPHFFLGSNPNGHNENSQLVELERSKTYGPVYGVYYGRAPTVVVSDPKLLKLILNRDFDHFIAHKHLMGFEHRVMSEVLDFLEGETWKTVRSVLTPSFTSGKIRQMSETVSEVAQEYVSALIQEKKGENVFEMNFRTYVQPMVLEIIGKCFCGINIENARDPDNKLIATLKDALGGETFSFDWTYTLVNAFPFLAKFSSAMSTEAADQFEQIMKEILRGRDESGMEKQDMVQILLEISRKAKTDPDYKRLKITQNTALGQAYEFFLASFEGLRTTLSMLTYFLATLPDAQAKLLKEVDAALAKNGGRVTWETVAELPYLTGCLSEVLRLTPGFSRPDRVCNKDWEHNGIKIKKNMEVIIPLWALHRDPEQFPDPDKFEPERFMAGRKEMIDTYAFGAFGNGPRACIGQRFTYEMLKIIVVHFMKEFTFQKRPDTVFKTKAGSPYFVIYEPVLVNFVRRN